MSTKTIENDLLLHWFSDIGKKHGTYKEPILTEETVKFFKEICDSFEQTTDVFIMTVELAEDYIRAKRSKNEKIPDPLLMAVTVTFLCHKSQGAPESLKIKHVIDLLFQYSQKYYTPKQVMAIESDILVTLNGKLPITTALDDMNVIIENYMSENKYKGILQSLCCNILECVYFTKKKLFKELREMYSENKECLVVFRQLIKSRFYLPISILITAIELSYYRHVLDIDGILADVTKCTKIHQDHVRIAVAKIMEIVNL